MICHWEEFKHSDTPSPGGSNFGCLSGIVGLKAAEHQKGSSFPIKLQPPPHLYLPVDSAVEAPPVLMKTAAPSVEDRLHTGGLEVPGSGLEEGP